MEHAFKITYKMPDSVSMLDMSNLLGKAGCTDVLVGSGLDDSHGLYFVREADTMALAIEGAKADIDRAIPGATVLSVREQCVLAL